MNPKKPKMLECRLEEFVANRQDVTLEGAAREWWESTDRALREELNITGPRHLVSLRRPLHALAKRSVDTGQGKWPDESVSSIRIAIAYCAALVALCDRVVDAVARKQLTVRDDAVGFPIASLGAPHLDPWRNICCADGQESVDAIPRKALRVALATRIELFPRVLVDPAEISRWAVAEGIVLRGELETLIAVGDPTMDAKPDSSDKDTWKTKAVEYANQAYLKSNTGASNPSKADIARAVALRLREEGITGPRGPLDASTILRHALTTWNKPSRAAS